LSNAKYEYAKIQRNVLLEDALAMIFIDFGLLRSPRSAKYLTYWLKSTDINIRVKIWQPMTQCAKIIVAFTANVGNVFVKRLHTFFNIFPHIFKLFFNVFF